jgi:hypothetical protein
MNKRKCSVLFLGKKKDEHVEKASEFGYPLNPSLTAVLVQYNFAITN